MTDHKNNNPQISIIVPVYKVEKYLDRCINSILNQTFRDFELILVDDGSPDNCPQMCDRWQEKDSRIRVIHKANGGLSSARNAGLKIAKGDYIGFVDSDDWILPTMYESLYSLIVKYKGDMAVCKHTKCKEKEFVPDKKAPIESPEINIRNREEGLKYYFLKDPYSVWNKLISSRIAKGLHFPEGRINEDVWACYYLYCKSEKTIFTNAQLYCYFVNESGITHHAFRRQDLDLLYIWEKVCLDTIKNEPAYSELAQYRCQRANFTLLSKMKIYGYDKEDQEQRNIYRKLLKAVRKDYWKLMRSSMPMSRKLLLIYIYICA